MVYVWSDKMVSVSECEKFRTGFFQAVSVLDHRKNILEVFFNVYIGSDQVSGDSLRMQG